MGSRGLKALNLGKYLPDGVTEIVSGGAKGIDTCAKEYATSNGIKLTEYLPEYEKYGRSAPLKRNITIVEYADLVLAFWDGASYGTKFVIDNCKSPGIPVKVFISAGRNWPYNLRQFAYMVKCINSTLFRLILLFVRENCTH